MTHQKDLLIIFTRNPELGKVKKRLAAKIGDSAALRLYDFLLQHTCTVSKNLACDKVVYYSETVITNDIWDSAVFQKKEQHGNNLGERMENAISKGFAEDYVNIVIIGSDLYDLREEDLEKAFSNLRKHDYVLGPASDGGYYLLGMKSLNSKLFKNKNWGTDKVLEETLLDLKNELVTMLEERNDIDTYEDLKAHPELQHLLELT